MTEPFSNEPIEVEHITQLRADAFVPVDSRYVWANLIGLTAMAVVVIGVAAAVVVTSGDVVAPSVVAGGIVVLLAAVATISSRVQVRAKDSRKSRARSLRRVSGSLVRMR